MPLPHIKTSTACQQLLILVAHTPDRYVVLNNIFASPTFKFMHIDLAFTQLLPTLITITSGLSGCAIRLFCAFLDHPTCAFFFTSLYPYFLLLCLYFRLLLKIEPQPLKQVQILILCLVIQSRVSCGS